MNSTVLDIFDQVNYTVVTGQPETYGIPFCRSVDVVVERARAGAETKATLRTLNYAAYCITMPILCAFGILGNILNLITLRSPVLQAVSYMYLRSLCIADLLCMGFGLEFVARMSGAFPAGEYYNTWYAAHVELPLLNVFIAACVLSVIALTIERYISVVFPVYFRQWNTPRRARIIISLAYVLSFLLHIPWCFERRVCIKIVNGTVFYSAEEDVRVKNTVLYEMYKWIREIIVKAVPVLGLAYFNIHIIVAFINVQRRRAQMVGRLKAGSESSRANDDRRLVVLLASIAVLFFVCNLPAAINIIVIRDSLLNNVQYSIFRAVANLLEIAKQAVNFYIFCMCSKDYRNEFFKTFRSLDRMRKFWKQVARQHSTTSRSHIRQEIVSQIENSNNRQTAVTPLIVFDPETNTTKQHKAHRFSYSVTTGKGANLLSPTNENRHVMNGMSTDCSSFSVLNGISPETSYVVTTKDVDEVVDQKSQQLPSSNGNMVIFQQSKENLLRLGEEDLARDDEGQESIGLVSEHEELLPKALSSSGESMSFLNVVSDVQNTSAEVNSNIFGPRLNGVIASVDDNYSRRSSETGQQRPVETASGIVKQFVLNSRSTERLVGKEQQRPVVIARTEWDL